MSVRVAGIFRSSTAQPEETTRIVIRTKKDKQGHPIRGPVSLYVDGEEEAEVDWVAESPSPGWLYRTVAQSGVQEVIAGGRSSFISCGVSGSGKSSTMFFQESEEGTRAGLLPRSAMHLFAELPASCEVRVSFVELYNDTLYDLLARGAGARPEAELTLLHLSPPSFTCGWWVSLSLSVLRLAYGSQCPRACARRRVSPASSTAPPAASFAPPPS